MLWRCTICQVFVRCLVLLSWAGDHILLLTSEEHSEVSVDSSICRVLLHLREFVAVSEGRMFPCLVWQQRYSEKLDLPASLASCAHPCGWDMQALQASARKISFLPRRLAGLTVLERWRLCLNLILGYCLTSNVFPLSVCGRSEGSKLRNLSA